jgi:predicted nucleotide-binding protein
MAKQTRFITLRVVLGGARASQALEDVSLPPMRSLDLGEGASASRPLLLSEEVLEVLNVVVDVATLAASVAVLANWLHSLASQKDVTIESIEQTPLEREAEEDIARIVREEVERKLGELGYQSPSDASFQYFHLQVILQGSNETDYEMDLPLDKVSSTLAAYVRGEQFMLNGRILRDTGVSRLRAAATDRPARDVYAEVEREPARPGTVRANHKWQWHVMQRGQDVTRDLVEAAGVSPSPVAAAPEDTLAANRRNVFVVHGRNAAARDAMFSFLRALDLSPMEWSAGVSETGMGSPYIGQVVDAIFAKAQAVVVLMTPDDRVELACALRGSSDPMDEVTVRGQARPNVFFEAGMAMALSQERTIIVELGSPKQCSDIDGRHTVRLDDSARKRQELMMRLETAGCEVHNGTDWLGAGEFEASVRECRLEMGSAAQASPVDREQEDSSSLSPAAESLLAEALNDENGTIGRLQMLWGIDVVVGDHHFTTRGNARAQSKWLSALDELTAAGLIEDRYGKGELFYVSELGYAFGEQNSD